MAIIDLKKTTLSIKDGGSNSIEINIGEGNLTYSERRTMEYKLNKGDLDTVREGDQQPMEVRFDFQWEFITATTATGAVPTVEEVLKATGLAAAWVTSSADACEPYAVDIEVAYDPACSPTENETITLPDFRYETLEHDLRAGQIACTGQCNAVVATIARA